MKAIRLDDLLSPYTFVPAPTKNVWPAWHGHVSHDRPFADGISGTLSVEITADTAIFVGGGAAEQRGQQAIQTFYRDTRGQYAIPGTTTRGVLRSVVEIASFGRMGPVNDLRLGFRDLQHDDYTKAMNGKVNAGWLHRDASGWYIEACHYALIDYRFIDKLGGPRFQPGAKQSAANKYRSFGADLVQGFGVEAVRRPDPRGDAPTVSLLGKVIGDNARPIRGKLVFTGQPMAFRPGDRNRKHSDFFFAGPTGHRFAVTEQQRDDFDFIHSADRQQGKDTLEPNEEWKFWQEEARRDSPVPVFFLLERGKDGQPALRAFGLAGMFRLAADQRVTDVVRRAQADGVRQQPDLAALIFGYVGDERQTDRPQKGALKGRVSVGMGRFVPGSANPAAEVVEAVFGVPKPSFYPYYLQHGAPDFDGTPRAFRNQRGVKYDWHTYMSADAKARGWKRYVVQRQAERRPFLPAKVKEDHLTRFRPLEPGARFTLKIRVHNLRPIELGALLWAIDFGGDDAARHRVGRGRALGFGVARLQVTGADLAWVDPKRAGDAADRAAHVAAFCGYMQSEVGDWAGSRTIFELCEAARPLSHADDARVGYPRLDPERKTNEFADIKKQGLVIRALGGRERHKAWKTGRAQVAQPDPMRWDPATAWVPPGDEAPAPAPKVAPAKVTVDRAERPAPVPQAPSTAPSADGWIEAAFANTLAAREVGKNLAKDHKKGRVRPRRVDLRLADDRVLQIDGAAAPGAAALFAKLSEANQPFAFHVRLEAGAIAEIALER